MKSVLVAGGAGFLGSNLCERLIKEGDEVYCLDNLSTSSARNIEDLFASDRFHFIYENAAKCVPPVDVDEIYNFASPAAPGHYKRDPAATMQSNVEGTQALLELATLKRARMLQVSTIRVDEPAPPESPHACYTEGKRRAEELCREYRDNKGTDVRIARLFNVYGPRMALDDSRVVPQFVMRALRDQELTIVGTGMQCDSFCYVDDILDGLTAFMRSPYSADPVTFGYPETISIYALAELIIRVTGSLSKISMDGMEWHKEFPIMWRDAPLSPIADRIPDISKARLRLGWEPKVPLDIGISRLADYYCARMATEN